VLQIRVGRELDRLKGVSLEGKGLGLPPRENNQEKELP